MISLDMSLCPVSFLNTCVEVLLRFKIDVLTRISYRCVVFPARPHDSCCVCEVSSRHSLIFNHIKND